MITQCFANGTVNLQYGTTKLGIIYIALININRILKLKILVREIFLMMSAYNCQLYNFILNIKAWNNVYNWMSTEALTVMSYWPCIEVFMIKYFIHNSCTFKEKGRA